MSRWGKSLEEHQTTPFCGKTIRWSQCESGPRRQTQYLPTSSCRSVSYADNPNKKCKFLMAVLATQKGLSENGWRFDQLALIIFYSFILCNFVMHRNTGQFPSWFAFHLTEFIYFIQGKQLFWWVVLLALDDIVKYYSLGILGNRLSNIVEYLIVRVNVEIFLTKSTSPLQ